MIRFFISLVVWISVCGSLFAVQPNKKNLPIGLAPFETIPKPLKEAPSTPPPYGPVYALGEWEEASSVMTLWPNASLIQALSDHNKVTLLADHLKDKNWWQNWLSQKAIAQNNISYYIVRTNSMWVRDYGPWFVVDGKGQMGLVDTIYNRPRPLDDKVPLFISRTLDIPYYQLGLVHTGGNFYPDGLWNGFSSTLVYTENESKSKTEVNELMRDYLGIRRYTTSELAPQLTIEHIDTFAKLVAPDTLVVAQFQSHESPYYEDTEELVTKLKALKSPYQTPYKIFRIRMIKKHVWYSDYRAYINSFISNRTLYMPSYGDDWDDYAQSVFEKALPGYNGVKVDAKNTSLGDSVHCRTRNIHEENTIFIFPRIPYIGGNEKRPIEIIADIIPSPGAKIIEAPKVHWQVNDSRVHMMKMSALGGFRYKTILPSQLPGSEISLYIEVEDSLGIRKMAPIAAPAMTIDFTIK